MKLSNLIVFILLLVACKSTNSSNSINPIFERNSTKVSNSNFPTPLGFVNDYENILTEEESKSLELFLIDYEKKTSREIAVITVNSIAPYDDVLAYGKDLGNAWGIGKSDKNNGLLIILDMENKQVGLSTGLGTERTLTDSICNQIIEEVIIPEFKKDDFYTGINNALKEIIIKWK